MNTRYGWDSRTRTCKARVKVSCVAVTPYPIGIMRTSGQGHFRPLFRYYNTKRLSCQYSGFADGGVRGSFCVCADRRHRFCRACGGGDARACVGVRDACDTCDTVEVCGAMYAILWRCAAEAVRGTPEAVRRGDTFPFRRTAVRCGLGTMRTVRGYGVCVGEYGWRGNTVRTGGGVRWRVRRAREYGAHGGYVLRRSRIICIMFRAFECARVSRVQRSAKSRRRLWRGGFFADLQ